MKRRDVFKRGFAYASAAALATPAVAQSTTKLSVITDQADAAASLAETLRVVSDGKLTMEIQEQDASLAAGFLKEVSEGPVDVYLTREEEFRAVDPSFAFFTSVPGGMSLSELEAWILTSDGNDLWEFLGEENGVKSFLASDNGAMPLWTKDPIGSLTDLTNASVACLGLSQDIMKKINVSQVADLNEVAGDLSGYSAIEGYSVAEMVNSGLINEFPNMMTPNVTRPSSALSMGIKLDKWNSFSETDRKLLEVAVNAHHGTRRVKLGYDDAVAYKTAGDALKQYETPEDVWQAQLEAAVSLMLDFDEISDMASDVAYSYRLFLSDVEQWSDIGETAYFQARRRALAL